MFEPIIDKLLTEARRNRDAWQRDGWARAAQAVGERTEPFLAWARQHRRWSFVVAEAADTVCAKPREAAGWVAHAIVEELLDED